MGVHPQELCFLEGFNLSYEFWVTLNSWNVRGQPILYKFGPMYMVLCVGLTDTIQIWASTYGFVF